MSERKLPCGCFLDDKTLGIHYCPPHTAYFQDVQKSFVHPDTARLEALRGAVDVFIPWLESQARLAKMATGRHDNIFTKQVEALKKARNQ